MGVFDWLSGAVESAKQKAQQVTSVVYAPSTPKTPVETVITPTATNISSTPSQLSIAIQQQQAQNQQIKKTPAPLPIIARKEDTSSIVLARPEAIQKITNIFKGSQPEVKSDNWSVRLSTPSGSQEPKSFEERTSRSQTVQQVTAKPQQIITGLTANIPVSRYEGAQRELERARTNLATRDAELKSYDKNIQVTPERWPHERQLLPVDIRPSAKFVGSKEEYTNYQSAYQGYTQSYEQYQKSLRSVEESKPIHVKKLEEFDATGRAKITTHMSQFSRGIYEKASGIAEPIRAKASDIEKGGQGLHITPKQAILYPSVVGLKAAAYITPRVMRTGAGLVETAGMIPGGVEGIVKQPRVIPAAVAYGGLSLAAGTVEQARDDPSQLMSDIVVPAFGLKGLSRVGGKITESVRYARREFVPPEKIIAPDVLSGKAYFPLVKKGTTPQQLVNMFEESSYKPSGATDVRVGGWHATPEAFPSTTTAQIGTSSVPGLHIAPSLSPHFLKVPTGIQLFGLGFDAPKTPSALWIKAKEVTTIPKSVSRSEATRFLLEEAEKGKAYVTPKFEALIKVRPAEAEAVFPPGTPLTRAQFTKYTKWGGKKIPILEYEAKAAETQAASLAAVTAKNQKTISARELSKTSHKEWGEYTGYKEPIITPASLAVSTSVVQSKKPFTAYDTTTVYKKSNLEAKQSPYKQPPATTPAPLYPAYKPPITDMHPSSAYTPAKISPYKLPPPTYKQPTAPIYKPLPGYKELSPTHRSTFPSYRTPTSYKFPSPNYKTPPPYTTLSPPDKQPPKTYKTLLPYKTQPSTYKPPPTEKVPKPKLEGEMKKLSKKETMKQDFFRTPRKSPIIDPWKSWGEMAGTKKKKTRGKKK